MQTSWWSYFVTPLISRHDTSIAQLHCQSALQLLQMSWRVIDVSAMTGYHWSLGHLVAPTNVNLSAVLLCHTDNISARSYRHLGEDRLPLVVMASPSSLDYCIRPLSLDYGIGLLS